MPDINEDIISAATPIDTPFTISIIDNDDDPYIVIDGKACMVDNI